jgi:4-alpha-glucanotransferase
LQFKFFDQWESFRAYVNGLGIKILGDMPIYVAMDSADTWANPEIFQLYDDGDPIAVAGCPPDYFSATGQLWGNPLYDWAEHEKSGYEWWISRVKRQLELVDYVRIDHFRGFESYWSVPADSDNAINGEWLEGPGAKLFKAMQKEIGEDLPIIAEDLGIITEEVEALRDEFHFPGMKVLQFGYGDMTDVKYIPQFYDTTNCVCYTGTHDNETTLGWYLHQSEEVKDRIRRTGNCDGSGVSLDFIRFALGSITKYAIFPIQDLLQLDNEARMNTPGVAAANWAFRYEQWQLDEAWRKDWLKIYTKVFGR